MKKSYGYTPRNRATHDAAQGQSTSGMQSRRSGSAAQTAAASGVPTNGETTLSVDDVDRQISLFFKEHE